MEIRFCPLYYLTNYICFFCVCSYQWVGHALNTIGCWNDNVSFLTTNWSAEWLVCPQALWTSPCLSWSTKIWLLWSKRSGNWESNFWMPYACFSLVNHACLCVWCGYFFHITLYCCAAIAIQVTLYTHSNANAPFLPGCASIKNELWVSVEEGDEAIRCIRCHRQTESQISTHIAWNKNIGNMWKQSLK